MEPSNVAEHLANNNQRPLKHPAARTTSPARVIPILSDEWYAAYFLHDFGTCASRRQTTKLGQRVSRRIQTILGTSCEPKPNQSRTPSPCPRSNRRTQRDNTTSRRKHELTLDEPLSSLLPRRSRDLPSAAALPDLHHRRNNPDNSTRFLAGPSLSSRARYSPTRVYLSSLRARCRWLRVMRIRVAWTWRVSVKL